MKTIAIDVWHDLREKKLAPVAILLVAALVAVPTLMAKSPEQPPPAPPAATAAATPAPGATPQLQPVTQLADSDLDTYSPKDPFAPLPALKAPSDLDVVSADPAAGGATDAGTTTGVAAGGGTDGGSSLPFSEGGGSGGTPVPQFIKPDSTPDAQTTLYTYVVDLDFGPPGAEKARNGVARLRVLPNEEKPVLVFLGVAADNKQAVFLADSTASQSGEGRCEPDVERCTFIFLTVDEKRNEHVVTDADGQDYLLRLREIRRVKVEDLERREAKRNKAKKSAARSGDSARAGVERAFGSLLLADESE